MLATGRLQIKPSGSGDENGERLAPVIISYTSHQNSSHHCSRPQSPSLLGHVVLREWCCESMDNKTFQLYGLQTKKQGL